MREHQRQVEEVIGDLRAMRLPREDDIVQLLRTKLRPWGRRVARLDLPLFVVQPTKTLGGTLDFDPENITKNIKTGYLDMIELLHRGQRLDDAEREYLVNERIW